MANGYRMFNAHVEFCMHSRFTTMAVALWRRFPFVRTAEPARSDVGGADRFIGDVPSQRPICVVRLFALRLEFLALECDVQL